jgi:hypothetical protein
MRVSYCTTCHGRLWQIAQTLFENIETLRDDEELVLLDYGSADGLKRFVESSIRCRQAITKGKLVYAYTEAPHYHCPKAKNLAHRLGKGDFLVNLDADNSIEGMRDVIEKVYAHSSEPIVLHMDNGLHNGAYGRICLARHFFYKLGGYNESFLPSAYQDTDIIERAKAMGLQYIMYASTSKPPISNTTPEKAMHTGNTDWWKMKQSNKAQSESDLKAGRLMANTKGWGKANVTINFGMSNILEPLTPIISIALFCGASRTKTKKLLKKVHEIPLVGEILLIQENLRQSDTESFGKVKAITSSTALDPRFQHAVATLASYPAVLLLHDQSYLCESTLSDLHQVWCRNPAIPHYLSELTKRRKATRKTSDDQEKLTPVVLTTPAACVQMLLSRKSPPASVPTLEMDSRSAKPPSKVICSDL